MKITFGLLIALACLAATTLASPIQIVQVPSGDVGNDLLETGRQQIVSAPPAVSAPAIEDEDDDDDDDDIEDALDDDDDDDDDEEDAGGAAADDDEDEDDDYIERFFDDILGDDDDDDDDDVSPSTGLVQPPSAPSAGGVAPPSAASAPSAVAAVDDAAAADYPIGDADSVVYDDEPGGGGAIDDGGVQIIDTAPGDAVKEPTAAEAAAVLPGNGESPLSSGASAAAAAAINDDDDDDEEEDDLTDALDDEDDDDDDEEEEGDEEDDDDDDLIGDDVIEARKSARALVQSAGGTGDVTPVPDILINKYNRFVDGIFGRINKILARSYDPVNVRLTSTETKSKTKKTNTSSANKKRKTIKGKTNANKLRHTAVATKSGAHPLNVTTRTARSNAIANAMPLDRLVEATTTTTTTTTAINTVATTTDLASKPASESSPHTIGRPASRRRNSQPSLHKRKKLTAPAVKATVRPKPKQSKAPLTTATHGSKIERARGILYGLSTLKRQGNVRVNVMADHTTVKSNFLLGPLQLKVEKAFGRGVRREVKSATATTTEMVGRIKLRIVNGAATLHSIKVQQPKQVQVVSADNHDRTREFVWKKSSHIADVVSQKLTTAVRSMLQPPPLAAMTETRSVVATPAVAGDRRRQRMAKVIQF